MRRRRPGVLAAAAAAAGLTACAPPSAEPPAAERGGWRPLTDAELELCRRDFGANFSPARAIPACTCMINRIERTYTLAELSAFHAKLEAAPDRAARNEATLADPKMGPILRACARVLLDGGEGGDQGGVTPPCRRRAVPEPRTRDHGTAAAHRPLDGGPVDGRP